MKVSNSLSLYFILTLRYLLFQKNETDKKNKCHVQKNERDTIHKYKGYIYVAFGDTLNIAIMISQIHSNKPFMIG